MRRPLYFIAIAAALAGGPALGQTVGTDQAQDAGVQTETDRTGTSTAPATTRQPGQDSMDRSGSQTTDPASVEPAAGQDMQGDRQQTDKDRKDRKVMGPVTTSDFIKMAAMSGRFEVESSEIVAEQTENAEVSAFARQMVNDHTKANDRLKELAQSANQGQSIEDDLDDKHQEKIDMLREAGGADLDRQYMDMQVKAHEKAVELFRNYSQNGDDVGLKGFAKDTLPTLERHLDHAQRLHKTLR